MPWPWILYKVTLDMVPMLMLLIPAVGCLGALIASAHLGMVVLWLLRARLVPVWMMWLAVRWMLPPLEGLLHPLVTGARLRDLGLMIHPPLCWRRALW